MADVHTKEQRSYNMSRIRSKDTKPELLVRHFLFSKGFRYRLHQKNMPGKPDLVFKSLKTVIFIHGCFWHGHEGCRYFKLPGTRSEWWREKIYRNRELDTIHTEKLISEGWTVIVIFECQLKKATKEDTLLQLNAQLLNIRSA